MNLKELLLMPVLVVVFFIGTPAQLQADNEVGLDKIIVTNRRAASGLSEASENVEVIGEEEIESLPARDLGEVLQYITGVDIEQRQGFGRPTSVSIQGADSRQVRVMIDGIPFNPQSSGQVNPSQFPIENISRIEVIKGPSSSIWGSSLGGVINIITKDTGNTLIPKGSVTSSFAEFRTRKESGELSGKIDSIGYYLFSSYMESGGKGPKDDVLEKKGFGKLSCDLKEAGRLIASFGYSGADVNTGLFPEGGYQSQPYRTRYGKLGWELDTERQALRIELKHSRQDIVTRNYDFLSDELPSWIVSAKDLLYQVSLNSSLRLREKDLLVLGADFDFDTLKSTYLTKAKSLNLQAPYASYTLKSGPWDFNCGLRLDRNSEFGQEVSPSLAAVYHLKSLPDTSIRAGVSHAFSAPPLLWKYYEESLAWITTNPDIKAERAWVYDLGAETKLCGRVQIKFSLYRADVSDAIALAENDAGKYYMKNFKEFTRQGGELQIKINLLERLKLFAAGTFNDVKDRVTGEIVKGSGKPRYGYELGLEYKAQKGLTLALKGYYDNWNEPDYSQANDRKMLFDFKVSRAFRYFTCFLNIHNLTNSKYWRDYYFPLPRRYFEGGVTFQW